MGMGGKRDGRASVSVVIPAYNAESFLARAVRSALEQTVSPLEVIIIDDGSTDGTVEVARALESDDPRVRLIALGKNGGPSTARNAGFAAAKGEWIAVLDADDAYLPERLEHLLSISDGAQIVADNLLPFDPATGAASKPVSRRTDGWEDLDLATFVAADRGHDDFGLFKPMFRRDFVKGHRLRYPEDVRHGEDFLLVFEALAKGAIYRLSWQPGYLYTTRHSGWSRTKVDYHSLADNLRKLSQRTDLKLSAGVHALLTRRIAFVEALEIREQVKNAVARGRLLRAFRLAMMCPAVWKFAYAKIRRIL
jgi:succinoglycan biosynthesis protein ExoO